MTSFQNASEIAAPETKEEVICLLDASGTLQSTLFASARVARKGAEMDTVKLRGVIEISNFCQKRCDYCAISSENKALSRYRMDVDTIVEVAGTVVAEGITTVFLQGGQDPHMDDATCEAIERIRKLNVNVLLNLGEKPRDTYARYAAAGADSYILKFETSDPVLHEQVINASLAKRLECSRWIREVGMKLGTGNIIGLPGQTIESVADDILLAKRMDPDFVSSSPFIPNENTPLEHHATGSLELTLNAIAICRLLFPNALIPAVSALEKLQKDGQLMGLNAGANVMTINFTPEDLRNKYAIYSRGRFVVKLDHARHTIARAGMIPRDARASPSSAPLPEASSS